MNRRAFLLGAAAVAVPKFDGPLPCDLPGGLPMTPYERLLLVGDFINMGFMDSDAGNRSLRDGLLELPPGSQMPQWVTLR